MKITAEHQRLEHYRKGRADWKKWGPYLSERSWGTVREDYSADGSAWDYFPHDHARSRVYCWKEYYFYLDSTPTHSYMKMLYKYPQAGYPYTDLVSENRRRGFGDLKGKDQILGATIVGSHAGNMISEISVAMQAGMGLGKLASVIHPYPTTAEAIRQCGDAYNRSRMTPTVKSIFNRLMAFKR